MAITEKNHKNGYRWNRCAGIVDIVWPSGFVNRLKYPRHLHPDMYRRVRAIKIFQGAQAIPT